ncbi:deoxyribose-phosphate aldolase [Treponema sp.]|uniref:deoxyribose-phosphate aldolase n=1 Tax=Treponema sp. TaxID=166 RepID=UPI00298DF287|nr:deoxyribose-phosphate aldolase [Treponema sp.]
MTKAQIAAMIDHTALQAFADEAEISKLCKEAKTYGFASVCINPSYIPFAVKKLEGSNVKVCTVIGFPLGADTTETKAFSAEDAVLKGADELDMVINVGEAKNKNFDYVEKDIKAVVDAARKAGSEVKKKIIVKVILETCYLTDHEVKKACIASKNAGADFVKTSTGFGTPKAADGTALPNGASVHHVQLMKKTVGDSMKVKAAGGIRSVRTAQDLIEAGADRLGTSSGLLIIQNWEE